jgi:hypothetical protein
MEVSQEGIWKICLLRLITPSTISKLLEMAVLHNTLGTHFLQQCIQVMESSISSAIIHSF